MNPLELLYLAGWIAAIVTARILGPNIDCNERWASIGIGIAIGLLLALTSRWI